MPNLQPQNLLPYSFLYCKRFHLQIIATGKRPLAFLSLSTCIKSRTEQKPPQRLLQHRCYKNVSRFLRCVLKKKHYTNGPRGFLSASYSQALNRLPGRTNGNTCSAFHTCPVLMPQNSPGSIKPFTKGHALCCKRAHSFIHLNAA